MHKVIKVLLTLIVENCAKIHFNEPFVIQSIREQESFDQKNRTSPR